MSFNEGISKTKILLMETLFKWWDLLWKQTSCSQWIVANTEVINVGGIGTKDHKISKTNDKYGSLKRSALSKKPLKSIIEIKLQQRIHGSNFYHAEHAWLKACAPFQKSCFYILKICKGNL